MRSSSTTTSRFVPRAPPSWRKKLIVPDPWFRRSPGKAAKAQAKAAELNTGALVAGFDFAASTLTKTDPFRVERMNATQGKIIIEGNAAAALGAMFAGVTVVTWYPITPSSSLVETLIGYLKRFRIDKETGMLTPTGHVAEVPTPVCILFAEG